MDLRAKLKKGLQEMKVDKEMYAQEIENPAEADVMYPYGLCIELDYQSLKKLNLQPVDFELGAEVSIVCKAKPVKVASSTGRMDKDACVKLQITHMEFDKEDKSDGN